MAPILGRILVPPSEVFTMRHEVHLHADIPILEGVSRRQIEQALAPLIEYLAAILARQFDKQQVAEVTALVNELFDRDWKDKAAQQKKPERAFENYTRPSRKNLH